MRGNDPAIPQGVVCTKGQDGPFNHVVNVVLNVYTFLFILKPQMLFSFTP